MGCLKKRSMPAPEPQSVHNLLVFLPVQEQEESDYAVIPQENTIGGAVIDYVDTLISQNEVSIVGEVELPIRQNLLGREGVELSDIQTVYSHKQGILQGADWLKKNLPQAEVQRDCQN